VGTQGFDDNLRQGDAPLALGRLGLLDDDLAAGLLERLRDRERSPVEVDVAPAQAGQFPATLPGRRAQRRMLQ